MSRLKSHAELQSPLSANYSLSSMDSVDLNICNRGSDVAHAPCVPRSHSCERPKFVKTVFAKVRTRNAKGGGPRERLQSFQTLPIMFLSRILLTAALAAAATLCA